MKRPQKPPKPPDPKPDDKRADVLVLTESRAAADAHSSTAAGLDALKDAGKSGDFKVAEAAESAGAFTEASLESYRSVVFLNTSGDILSDNEQSAFEHFFSRAAASWRSTPRSPPSPTGPSWTSLLGTRAEPGTPPVSRESTQQAATIKVADRVHDASKSLAERFAGHATRFYNTHRANVRGLQHVLATVDEDTYASRTAPRR